jgi:hypothetical protein
MAKIIEFYVPSKFRNSAASVPPQQRGKVIEFRLPVKKSDQSYQKSGREESLFAAALVPGCTAEFMK